MSKIKTKQLFNEVSNHLKNNLGFHIECNYSDNVKSSICRENPNFRDESGKRKVGEFKYIGVCEFNVFKNYKSEKFIIWDKRIKQPYRESKHCVYIGSFGRYEFNDKVSFYNHILSDFGYNWWDSSDIEKEEYQNCETVYWDIKEGIIK